MSSKAARGDNREISSICYDATDYVMTRMGHLEISAIVGRGISKAYCIRTRRREPASAAPKTTPPRAEHGDAGPKGRPPRQKIRHLAAQIIEKIAATSGACTRRDIQITQAVHGQWEISSPYVFFCALFRPMCFTRDDGWVVKERCAKRDIN